jgi:hypothetical protein
MKLPEEVIGFSMGAADGETASIAQEPSELVAITMQGPDLVGIQVFPALQYFCMEKASRLFRDALHEMFRQEPAPPFLGEVDLAFLYYGILPVPLNDLENDTTSISPLGIRQTEHTNHVSRLKSHGGSCLGEQVEKV